MQIKEGEVVTPLRPFPGTRIDKAATKALRARFKIVFDALPMYHLAHNGMAPNTRPFPDYNTHDLQAVGDVEDDLEAILHWVLSKTKKEYWKAMKGWRKEPSTLKEAHAFLTRTLSVYEDYITGVFVVE